MFRGVYADFASARAAIPRHRTFDREHAASAQRLLHDRLRIFAFDYPVMFWLSQLLPANPTVFDWGGNVGISYFAYRQHMRYPPDLDWLVRDLAIVASLGRQIAERESAPGLRFTDNLDELPNADFLLAAGVLHFVESPLGLLRGMSHLPAHALINKVPAYDLPDAVTLQNMGTDLCPNHLFNRADFIAGFERLGYQLIDQ